MGFGKPRGLQVQSRGLRYSFAILFNRIVPQWLFRMRRYVVYEMDVEKARAVATSSDGSRASEVEISVCQTEEQIKAVEALTWFKREYSSGKSQPFQAAIDGELVAGVWIATETFDEDELGVRLMMNDRQAWLFAALVSKQSRGKGIYGKLLPFVVSETSQNFPSVLLAVNPDNKPSNAVHKKWSQQTVGTVVAIRLLGVAVCWTFGQIRKDRTISWQAKKNPIQLTVE